MAAVPEVKPATMRDLEALPGHLKGELIDGVLYAMTRPRAVHQGLAGLMLSDLTAGFFRPRRGGDGPTGWWILPEPGLELPNAPEVSPDLAGWHRERLPVLPRDTAINVVPNWVCEVLSPTTRRHNLLVKRPFYARVGVAWLWLVDLDAMVLHVQKLDQGRWLDIATFGDERDARAEPFDAVPLDVRAWWDAISEPLPSP